MRKAKLHRRALVIDAHEGRRSREIVEISPVCVKIATAASTDVRVGHSMCIVPLYTPVTKTTILILKKQIRACFYYFYFLFIYFIIFFGFNCNVIIMQSR